MSPEIIMLRLRWMGNLLQMYLRDTGMIQDKHRDILRAALQEVLDLIAGPNLSLLPSVFVLFVVPGHICVFFCLFSTMCISITIKY